MGWALQNRREYVGSLLAIAGSLLVTTGHTTPSVAASDENATIRLLGYTPHWEGVEPEDIAGVPNPTLVLEEGEEYTIRWENGDGAYHNFVVLNGSNHLYLATDAIDEGEQEVAITADPSLNGGTYYCDPHRSTMIGDIVVGTSTPAELDFSVTAPEAVDGGETFDIDVEVTNSGDETGRRTLEVTFGHQRGTAEIAVGGGNTQVETFDFDAEGSGGQQVEWSVSADGADVANGTVAIAEIDSDDATSMADWADVDEIALLGEIGHWIGRKPPMIDGVENPVLELVVETEYTVTWENVDGREHNFAIRNIDGENIVATDRMGGEGNTQDVTFEAGADMDEYVCEPHAASMTGSITILGSDGDSGTDDDGDGMVDDTNDDVGLPGFGAIAAIVGLGGGAAAAARRLIDHPEEK